mmetsp:Transcript_2609/g.7529  ORF Transcript_2609/g.7529 Transcript_2609/m.7529 type:complete len:240 (+) Transcript_2609:362-1081(+)
MILIGEESRECFCNCSRRGPKGAVMDAVHAVRHPSISSVSTRAMPSLRATRAERWWAPWPPAPSMLVCTEPLPPARAAIGGSAANSMAIACLTEIHSNEASSCPLKTSKFHFADAGKTRMTVFRSHANAGSAFVATSCSEKSRYHCVAPHRTPAKRSSNESPFARVASMRSFAVVVAWRMFASTSSSSDDCLAGRSTRLKGHVSRSSYTKDPSAPNARSLKAIWPVPRSIYNVAVLPAL